MLVLVYVGAVMVLFLFVVMMLDINVEALRSGLTRYAPLGIIAAADDGRRTRSVVVWLRGQGLRRPGGFAAPEGYSNTEALGAVLYTEHVYAFEIAAVILLLAIVAAITLTMRKRPGPQGAEHLQAGRAVRREDRVRVVKMAGGEDDDRPAATT